MQKVNTILILFLLVLSAPIQAFNEYYVMDQGFEYYVGAMLRLEGYEEARSESFFDSIKIIRTRMMSEFKSLDEYLEYSKQWRKENKEKTYRVWEKKERIDDPLFFDVFYPDLPKVGSHYLKNDSSKVPYTVKGYGTFLNFNRKVFDNNVPSLDCSILQGCTKQLGIILESRCPLEDESGNYASLWFIDTENFKKFYSVYIRTWGRG